MKKPNIQKPTDAEVQMLVQTLMRVTGATSITLSKGEYKMDKFKKANNKELNNRSLSDRPGWKQFYADHTSDKEEVWENGKYIVHVERGLEMQNQKEGKERNYDEPVLMTHLSIRNVANDAEHDWRDYQWIKNELVGEENEAIEFYPAESRLVDTCNQFHLWVFENPKHGIPIGFVQRAVIEKAPHGYSNQRPFPDDRKPKDLEECTQREAKAYEEYLSSKPKTNE